MATTDQLPATAEPGPVRPVPAWIRRLGTISTALAALAGLALGLMVLHIVVDVAGRTLARQPVPGTLEYVQYVWMPTITLAAMAYAEKMRTHPRVTVALPPEGSTPRRVVDVVAQLATVAVVALLFVNSIPEAAGSVAIGEAAISTLTVPIWPAKIAAVVAFAAFLLQSLLVLARLLMRLPETENSDD